MTYLDKTKRSKFNPPDRRLSAWQKFWIACGVLGKMATGQIRVDTKNSGILNQHAPMPYWAVLLLSFIAIRLMLIFFGF